MMRFKAIGTIVLMIAAALVFPVGVGADTNKPTEILTVNDIYNVEGNETWLRVVVMSTGNLIVGKGARLEAQKIQLKDGAFEVNGGTVVLGGAEPGNDVNIKGKATYFTLKNGAKLTLNGPAGTNNLDQSKGGDASIVVSVSQEIYINGATIECNSGSGYSNPVPWVEQIPLDGYFAAGGNASVEIGSGTTPVTTVKALTVKLAAGNGGRAADATHPNSQAAGKGGGYSNGGDVSGWVGAGGRTAVTFAGMETNIDGLTVTATSGNGGRAGNGGGLPANYQQSYGSGGGGGYSGGDGVPYTSQNSPAGGKGGKVSGFVGAGGDCEFQFTGLALSASRIDITATAGRGGDAGNGGSGCYYNGGGGGGYGGGGGTGYGYWSGTQPKGGSGTLAGRIGSGGQVKTSFRGDDTLYATNISYTGIGGNGGKGGDGGQGGQYYGGGGGAGYGGGGGGALYSGGGETKMTGEVGAGGNVSATFNGGLVGIFNSTFVMFGGSGGKGGSGGRAGYYTGGGGGGYGGGGGSYGYQTPSGSTEVGNNTGRGGAAMITIDSPSGPGGVLARSNKFYMIGGTGGDGGMGGAAWNYGCGGGGGYGGGGGAYQYYTAGTTKVGGGTGDGGGVGLVVRHEAPSISKLNSFSMYGGTPGNGKTQAGGGTAGGAGAGAKTAAGATISEIPMGVPILVSPADGEFINFIAPTLEWEHILYSTTDGDVISYSVQVDNNEDFESPEIDTGVEMDSTFTPTSELSMGGIYYWRVMATYMTGNSYGYGPARKFSFNTPPVLTINIPLQNFPEDNQNNKGFRLVNLSKYFKDDLFNDKMQFSIVYETDPSHILGTIDGNFMNFATPTKDWYGQERFAVRASDPMGLWVNSNNFTVRVTPVNDPPVLNFPSELTVTEGMEHFLDLSPYITDVDSKVDQMTVTTNSSFVRVDGLGLYFNYTPGMTGELVKVTVNDTIDQSSAVIRVAVEEYIAPPVIVHAAPWEIVMTEDTEYTYDLVNDAVDQKTPSAEIVWNVTAVSAGNPPLFNAYIVNKHILKIVPAPDAYTVPESKCTLVLVAINGGGKEDSRTVSVGIQAVNDPPMVTRIPDVRIMAGTTQLLDLSRYITDVDTPLADLKVSSPSPLVNIDGMKMTIYVKADAVESQDVVVFQVSDGLDTSQGEFLIRMQFPPAMPQLIPNIKTSADKVKSIDLKEFVLDKDTPEAALKWSVSGVSDRYFSAAVDPNTHILKITPKKAGRGELTLTVTDPEGGTASQVVLVNVVAPPQVDSTPTGLYVVLVFVVIAAIIGVALFIARPKK
jgi:hypothetical protein